MFTDHFTYPLMVEITSCCLYFTFVLGLVLLVKAQNRW